MNVKTIKKKAICIIPARYESTRLPGKPLINIAGKPLIQWVWESAIKSTTLSRTVIATDDERIAEFCNKTGAEWLMTPTNIQSGSDRIAYTYKILNEDADIILNLQGDEPLIKAEVIDSLIHDFSNSNADVGTLIKKINSNKELFDASVVKVVVDSAGKALYFSRSPIPYLRDINQENWLTNRTYWKHIGIYAYSSKSLQEFSNLNPSELELSEKLEQLRLLENGAKYLCMETDLNLIGVDTKEDIVKVEKILNKI
ncbi:MAG: 3-deoxy-manno-octulosonate cytidylyltransferase [Bacteroidetes bacterium]|nr:MAG: 3-deoxy-manno-octulosonate cytidylyltransferase [Bacteroidota bacterium]